MRHSLPDVTHAIVQGTDIDALDRKGRTPLFYAVRDGDLKIAAALIQHGANVNAQDKDLETPLHFAAREYQSEAAELLLQNGANVDAQDVQGNSPLFRAVFDSRGRDQVIGVLLAAGAKKDLKNRHGVSPEDLAKSIANYNLSPLLVRKSDTR
jgi:uncharacterized protein